jgi:hypothetical protein
MVVYAFEYCIGGEKAASQAMRAQPSLSDPKEFL